MKGMILRVPRRLWLTPVALLLAMAASAQVIEYEANGQKYQTLTRKGLTVIVTHMANQVAGYGLLQISISNGSDVYWTVQPEGFSYVRADQSVSAISAGQVVDVLLDKGSHADVVNLVKSYENNLYGIPHMRSSNGYEQRRQNAFSLGMPAKLKAAATASAVALALTRLAPGQSTDGSVFIRLNHEMKALTGGRIIFYAGSETFEFNAD